jgi:hypothetical protein
MIQMIFLVKHSIIYCFILMLFSLCLGSHYLSALYFRLAAGADPMEVTPQSAQPRAPS